MLLQHNCSILTTSNTSRSTLSQSRYCRFDSIVTARNCFTSTWIRVVISWLKMMLVLVKHSASRYVGLLTIFLKSGGITCIIRKNDDIGLKSQWSCLHRPIFAAHIFRDLRHWLVVGETVRILQLIQVAHNPTWWVWLWGKGSKKNVVNSLQFTVFSCHWLMPPHLPLPIKYLFFHKIFWTTFFAGRWCVLFVLWSQYL